MTLMKNEASWLLRAVFTGVLHAVVLKNLLIVLIVLTDSEWPPISI